MQAEEPAALNQVFANNRFAYPLHAWKRCCLLCVAVPDKPMRRALIMAQGISVHVGLNRVDPDQYEGWDGQLTACEADAKDMEALAKAQGFKSRSLLLTKAATAAAVSAAISSAAKTLKSGDLFFLTYSGHGGQVADTNRD